MVTYFIRTSSDNSPPSVVSCAWVVRSKMSAAMTTLASCRLVHARATFKPTAARASHASRVASPRLTGVGKGVRGLLIARRAEQSGGERVSSEDAVAESGMPKDDLPAPENSSPKDLGAQIQELKNKGSGGGTPKEAENPFVGAFEEIGHTEWPSPVNALKTTGIVIGIVTASAFVLLTVNSALSAISQAIFK